MRDWWSHQDKAIRWAIILSLAWGGAAIATLWTFTECEKARSACLAPNELGDLLAGLFAPVAFLWVAAAVFVQSRELAEQREELTLTRKAYELAVEEARETRGVLQAQQHEARRQAEYMEVQTISAERQLLTDGQRRALTQTDVNLRVAMVEFYPFFETMFHRLDVKADVTSLPPNSRFRSMPIVTQAAELWRVLDFIDHTIKRDGWPKLWDLDLLAAAQTKENCDTALSRVNALDNVLQLAAGVVTVREFLYELQRFLGSFPKPPEADRAKN